MPELPEVEVTRLGVAPYLEGRMVSGVVFRHKGLRWPFPEGLGELLAQRVIRTTGRRGKYLLLGFDHGTLIIHLGMSGHLRILSENLAPGKHDHFDLVTEASLLRMTDPRRFGAVLWHAHESGDLAAHPLLRGLGIEPFEDGFDGRVLFRATRGRKAPVKQVLLGGAVVVGVGNIYACESLFQAGIHPATPAGRISLARYQRLADAIRAILAQAIRQGGSTLKDFVGADGQSGYFQQSYFVYDRAGLPCRVCGKPVRQIRQGQRSTFYCTNCQK